MVDSIEILWVHKIFGMQSKCFNYFCRCFDLIMCLLQGNGPVRLSSWSRKLKDHSTEENSSNN